MTTSPTLTTNRHLVLVGFCFLQLVATLLGAEILKMHILIRQGTALPWAEVTLCLHDGFSPL